MLTGVPRLVPPAQTSRAVEPSYRLGPLAPPARHLLSDDRMEALRRKHGSADYRNASRRHARRARAVVNEDYEDAAAAHHVPGGSWCGATTTPPPRSSMAERARPLFGGPATLTVVPGAGHLTPLTAPDALRAALEAGLR